MTTIIANPTTLEGFAEVDGIRLSPIGDDGELLIAVGHHDETVAARAFLKFGHGLLWEDPLGGFDELNDAAACVSHDWGQFLAGSTPAGWTAAWGTDLKGERGTSPITIFDLR